MEGVDVSSTVAVALVIKLSKLPSQVGLFKSLSCKGLLSVMLAACFFCMETNPHTGAAPRIFDNFFLCNIGKPCLLENYAQQRPWPPLDVLQFLA